VGSEAGPATAGLIVDRQYALLQKALHENYKLLFFLFNETVHHPVGSRQSGRGLYVLIHIVTDAFSAEHTTRDTANHLLTVKEWRTNRIGWPPNAREMSSEGEDLALLHRGMFSKTSADDYWATCTHKRKKKEINHKCELSPVELKAGEAVRDLLIAVYQSLQDTSKVEESWSQFV
jgi:hypothetical protein